MTCLSLLTPCIFLSCAICVLCVFVLYVCLVVPRGTADGFFLSEAHKISRATFECLAMDLCHHVSNGLSKEHTKYGIKCRTNADDATALSLAGILSQHKVEGGCESCFKTVPYLAVFPNSSSS